MHTFCTLSRETAEMITRAARMLNASSWIQYLLDPLLIYPYHLYIAAQVAAGYVLHVGTMSRGTFKLDAVINAEVDHVRRERIVPNHTFTHVLNFALREVRFLHLLIFMDA